jgi:hypothetical protein
MGKVFWYFRSIWLDCSQLSQPISAPTSFFWNIITTDRILKSSGSKLQRGKSCKSK